MTQTVQFTSQRVVEVVPLVMGVIGARPHERRAAHMRVPQFRAMLYVNRCQDTFLSELADHVGISRPSLSKLIDGPADHRPVGRGACQGDRRRFSLCLTPKAEDELGAAYTRTQKF